MESAVIGGEGKHNRKKKKRLCRLETSFTLVEVGLKD